MKLKSLNELVLMADNEGVGDDIIQMLYDHFNYSINDIKSYDELTNEEKKFINKAMFERIVES